jgi:predicted solute-binding protein
MQELPSRLVPSLSEPRIQGVAYLNAWPVLYGLMLGKEPERLRMALPSVLAARLVTREADVALAPVATLAQRPGFEVAPRICIGADGPVASVLIVSQRPLAELDLLLLDTASRTSVVLAQLVADHVRKGQSVEVEPADVARIEHEVHGTTGAVVIGDRALSLRSRFAHVLDLGEVWRTWTGLPFVFAAWIAQEGALDERLLRMLDHSLSYGLGARREIAHMWAAQHGGDPGFFERYLTENIRYELDERFEAGLLEFFARAASAGLMDPVRVRFARS